MITDLFLRGASSFRMGRGRRRAERRDMIAGGPIRGELLGTEGLARRAREVARSQRLVQSDERRRTTPLLDRLADSRRVLETGRERIARGAARDADIGPAGEWLLDNFHVVDEHLREVHDSLPPGYYRELPILASGPLAGHPRAYELAITLIAHTEGRVNFEAVELVTAAFQEVAPLTIGELWAVPAMLRLALLESVRRMTLRTVQRLDEVDAADLWAARIQVASHDEGSASIGAVLREFIAGHPPLTPVFVARFLRQLRLGDAPFTPLVWLEQYLSEEGLDAEDAATRSAGRLAATQVVMANSMNSLRAITHMDWREFVEQLSQMDVVLRGDPAGVYAGMTFATRDRYRHVVERTARRTRRGEPEVAAMAVELARQGGREHPDDERRGHVGYYLVDDGRARLEALTGYHPTTGERLHRWVLRHPNVVFVGGVAAAAVAALAALLWLGGAPGRSAWLLVLVVGLLPAVNMAVSVVNQLVTVLLPPRTLPKLELRAGRGAGAPGRRAIPPELRTAVVVPTLFDSVEGVQEALEHLEAQFLANREANLHFALLSDFVDSPAEAQPDDDVLVAAAVQGIEALNERYADGGDDVFYLFHRPRRWNECQGCWMGWERKRGKLAEFNQFLRGGAAGAFSTVVGNVEVLRKARYVITLDADTVLPPEAAPLLIGAMAHPLNRAVYDARKRRVTRGYGILQPRVSLTLTSSHRSRFAAIQSGQPGVDPYTTAVSDVYQDLYGEGSFTGKGIYEVDVFEQATRGRFPVNSLLSHDLIEGNYARAGLVTDVTVYDDYPARYLTYARRKHRWIRGDWQLLRWLTRQVPGPDGPERNRLSLLSRWKIFDNLRRSTVEIAQLALFAAAWTVLPGSPLRWTVLALLAVAAPWIVALLLAALRPPRGKSLRVYYAGVGRDAAVGARQVALAVLFLPHQAWLSADAIIRTLWRLAISRRHLLEWQAASLTERAVAHGVTAAWRQMWPSVALAIALFVAALWSAVAGPGAPAWQVVIATLPLTLAWIAAPFVAHSLAEPAVRRERRVSPARRREIMRYALLHWRFFERFVGPETHWLAPDNVQEDPRRVVAMRTSPTNIGLQLLSTISAHDLGFVTMERMADLLERAFETIERLPRFRGHLYNWYDLEDLRVLEPAYVSTVDSGNLAGHLLAVRQACLILPDEPLFGARTWRALDAALGLVETDLRVAEPRAERGAVRRALEMATTRVRSARSAIPRYGEQVDPAERLGAVATAVREASDALADQPLLTGWLGWILELADSQRARIAGFAARQVEGRGGEVRFAFPSLREVAARSPAAATLVERLDALAGRADRLAGAMDFRFLYDHDHKLFTVGYQTTTRTPDPSYYDLLASEARLASFVAVARSQVPVEHWYHLGRTLTRASGETALVSWSGSMFEYLMPLLVMQSFPATLLDQTCTAAVRRQQAYGAEHGTPWGVSESAYNLRDRYQTYQYRAFGVPNLALKRGLGRDLVIAPYAAALAAMVDTTSAVADLRAFESLGALGQYGFHDAVDYTRPDPGARFAIVRNYMAHHVGMSLVALTNALRADVWPRRFHADPLVRSAELLLHERIPRRLELQEPQTARVEESYPDPALARPTVREIDTPHTPRPVVALLGHLPYTIMVTNGGSGYSRHDDLAVTRWRADGTRDDTGQFCYVRDTADGRVWSAGHQPVCAPADWYHVALATDRVIFHRGDGAIETRTEIAVAAGDAAEVRRVTVTNTGTEPRELELTSYGEVVLAQPDADRAHPAFANLFVETEWHEWCSAITAKRRPRSATEHTPWGVHVVSVAEPGEQRVGSPTCETDRARFVGRGRSTRNPIALTRDGPLPGSTGAVLDPIFSIRVRVRLEPGRSASVAFTTLVASTRERALELADRYHDPRAAQRALDLAWTAAQVELRELDITPAEAALYQEIAGHLFFGTPALRAPEEEMRRNHGTQPQLWAVGVSGDWPILLATIDAEDGLPTLRQLLSAHHYWRRRGMMVDLVVLNTRASGYLQMLQDAVTTTVLASSESGVMDQPGGVFVRQAGSIAEEDLLMLRSTARVHVACDGRSLARLLRAGGVRGDGAGPTQPAPVAPEPLPRTPERTTPATVAAVTAVAAAAAVRRTPAEGMATQQVATQQVAEQQVATQQAAEQQAAEGGATAVSVPGAPAPGAEARNDGNGFGGLTAEGNYELCVAGDHVPPAPWTNVIANPNGGFVVSERGTGTTWAGNSFFYRLTPWHNDPVSDPAGDVIYLQDSDSGALWSATPAPVPGPGKFTVRHAPGASTFEHERDGIATLLTLGTPEHDAVKISLLRITNTGGQPRRLTITAYAEWVLGTQREHSQHQVQTTFEPDAGVMLARNTFDPQFAGWRAFCGMSEPVVAHTGDRGEFVGRNGTLAAPAALAGGTLSGTTGAALDPCAALQCTFEVAPGEARELVVVLGAADGEGRAHELARRYGTVESAAAAIAATREAWEQRLSVVRVRTPEPEFDVMVNRWTLYQALACRMWARSALYQSSGAYGFRDQLQDVLAFVYAEPAIAREHILRAAGRQFVEGDVQHWWHPQSGRGVRTRFSDDLAWLPFVVDGYVRVTGDASVLDEVVPFLTMRPLEPDEQEVYDLPQVSDERASVYEHCLRALRKACTAGSHGLPLIGGGDWNDGMNRVGVEGRGESVWLAWFLITTLRAFAEHVEGRGDHTTAAELREQATAYASAVEEHGWDGAWYRRAYFDDGTPLGSAQEEECRMDSIAQSWSVISGAGDPARQAEAMQSLEQHLVRDDARLLMLLTPPFDRAPHDPGYIKGYLPGVRENGAQYTHAALWAVLATAMRGDGDRAFELYQMINPLTHAATPEGVATYKVEPYVVAADVYTARGQLGRGGWTWYTGSASWMYRVGLEAILGFTRRGDTLTVEPRVPARWPSYTIEYRFGRTTYAITVRDPARVGARGAIVTLDGEPLDGSVIPLVDDGGRHEVLVTARPAASSRPTPAPRSRPRTPTPHPGH